MPHTILCAEDNLLALHPIKNTIEMEGWHVDVCEDGAMASERIKSSERHVRCLLI